MCIAFFVLALDTRSTSVDTSLCDSLKSVMWLVMQPAEPFDMQNNPDSLEPHGIVGALVAQDKPARSRQHCDRASGHCYACALLLQLDLWCKKKM